MEDSNDRRIPWALFVSEAIGTALLILVGLSLVILMFGTGSPIARDPKRGAETCDHRFSLVAQAIALGITTAEVVHPGDDVKTKPLR